MRRSKEQETLCPSGRAFLAVAKRTHSLAWVAIVLTAGQLAGCVLDTGGVGPGGLRDDDAAPSRFRGPVILETPDSGQEPSLEIAPDGTIYVCSLRGSARGSNLWRSTDSGETFRRIGEAPQAVLPPTRSRFGDIGGSDCDVSTDEAGTLYLVDLWIGSVSVAVSRDQGETWDGVPVSFRHPVVDRPWVFGGKPDEVFLIAHQLTDVQQGAAPRQPAGGIWVVRSTDAGKTFPQQVLVVSQGERSGWYSNLVDSRGSLLFVYETRAYKEDTGDDEDKVRLFIASSADRGATWRHQQIAEQSFVSDGCFALIQFPALAADDHGGVYAAWALDNPETSRIDVFLASSVDAGRTWTKPILVTERTGTRAFPSIAATPEGKVGLAWYETNVTSALELDTTRYACVWANEDMDNADWFLWYEELVDDSGRPASRAGPAQARPVYHGPLDRPFAELLQIEFGPDGNPAIAYVSDTPEAPTRPSFVQGADMNR